MFPPTLTIIFSGEHLLIKLEGKGIDANICLDNNAIIFNDTYIGETSVHHITLQNHTDFIVSFDWETCAIQEDEEKTTYK